MKYYMQGLSKANNHSKVVKWQNKCCICDPNWDSLHADIMTVCDCVIKDFFYRLLPVDGCCSLNRQLIWWSSVNLGASQLLKAEYEDRGCSQEKALWQLSPEHLRPTNFSVFQNSISKIVLSSFYIYLLWVLNISKELEVPIWNYYHLQTFKAAYTSER